MSQNKKEGCSNLFALTNSSTSWSSFLPVLTQRKEVQQFLVERSNLAILLLNLNGNVPLEEDESRGFCLRGFEQYFSTAVRQQILARRIEHRTMVLMEQYRQVCDLGRRDPSLLRACIQHISQPAIDEALVLAALDTRAISDDLATCRLYFPLCQQAAFGYRNNGFSTTTATSPTTATTTLHATLPSTEYTANYNSIDSLVYQRPSVTPSTSFLETSKDRQVSGNDHKNQQWTTRTTTTKQQRTNRKANKLAPLKSSSVLMANPVVIPLPPQQNPEPALSS